MQPIEAKASTYIDFAVESNDTIPKLKVDCPVIISKYKNILGKVYTSNCLHCTTKMFSIKDFFSKYDHIWPYLHNESLIKNFLFCAVPRKAFLIKKSEALCHGDMLLVILTVKKLMDKNKLQKKNQTQLIIANKVKKGHKICFK